MDHRRQPSDRQNILVAFPSLVVRLHTLSLEQFRNYPSLTLDLSSSDRHLFIGSNGSGKTNILEAISVLSLTKSALGIDEEHLMQWGSAHYRVKGLSRTDTGEDVMLETVSQLQPRKQKACFVNDVRVQASAVIGRLPIVLFLPQDLQLFSGPPAERRRFVDQLLSQVSSEYFQALSDYLKFVKQRNALLKSIAQGASVPADLDTWDEQLAERGSIVTLARLELMETFSLALVDELRTLGEHWTDVKIVYERSSDSHTRADIAADIRSALRSTRDRDILLQSTSVGPHRDDWYITAEGHPLATFASRGQQRVSVLALLFLQASFVELRRGERPLILLDDVFSELDDSHQEGVLNAFVDHQVFITGTHLPKNMEKAQVWNVTEGEVFLAQ
ncbi:MAG: replication and repair protein RecF [Candidatus Peribacteria bacterium]|nr:replication and repair protein RecF [Candidatus Peribacteria bacterium]